MQEDARGSLVQRQLDDAQGVKRQIDGTFFENESVFFKDHTIGARDLVTVIL